DGIGAVAGGPSASWSGRSGQEAGAGRGAPGRGSHSRGPGDRLATPDRAPRHPGERARRLAQAAGLGARPETASRVETGSVPVTFGGSGGRRAATGRSLAGPGVSGYPFPSSMDLGHRTLEQLLLDQGRISPEDLRKVRRLQQERGERLERLLLDLGFISEEDLQPLLAAYLGVQVVARRDFPTEPVPLGKLNLKYLRRAKVLPLAQQNSTLTVAMVDPGDYYALHGLQVATGLEIEPRLARERDVL